MTITPEEGMHKKYSEHGSKAGEVIAIDEDCLITGDPWLVAKKDLEGKTFFARTIKHKDSVVGSIIYSTSALIPDNYLDISFKPVSIQGCKEYLDYITDLKEINLDYMWPIVQREIMRRKSEGFDVKIEFLSTLMGFLQKPLILFPSLDRNLPVKEGVEKYIVEQVRDLVCL
ncbi:hypothetical protein H5T00_05005 [Escherichia coli]|uniref:hypothetical protein n=1 Tax=Escherichia coli TaxID=562 RepID=UPI0007A5B701|nr:hypothetical protein [Escherichia coli]EFL8354432.1 hypothetical protein [Escherichia coli]MBZ8916903.1 hypothetical protein [Escherichia coli]MBZ9135317.1 hypothetical protein [Escherichia coli]MCF4076294.1 hypothetical protein [Escherichia coli]MEC5362051.1 hypothetical protein [Escherichia coli]